MKKKIVSLILVGAMALSMAACGNSNGGGNDAAQAPADTAADAAVSEEAPEAAPADTGIDPASVTDADIAGAKYQLQLAVAVQDEPFIEGFAENIYALSNGQVGVTTVALDSLGTSDDAVAMLKNGTIAMYYNSAAQTPTSFPVADVFTIPYLFESAEQQNAAVYDLYEAGYLSEFDDQMVPLLFATTDPQMLIFADKQPQTPDDMKGLKIRATSGTSVNMIENMGASVVSMGFGDVFLSLDRGVIDGAMSSPNMMDPNAWYDVTSYLMDVDFFWGVTFCAMSKTQFDTLPEDCQQAIIEAGKQQQQYVMDVTDETGNASLAHMQENGVELYEVDDTMKDAFSAQAEELVAAQAKALSDKGFDGDAIIKAIQDSIAAHPAQ